MYNRFKSNGAEKLQKMWRDRFCHADRGSKEDGGEDIAQIHRCAIYYVEGD